MYNQVSPGERSAQVERIDLFLTLPYFVGSLLTGHIEAVDWTYRGHGIWNRQVLRFCGTFMHHIKL